MCAGAIIFGLRTMDATLVCTANEILFNVVDVVSHLFMATVRNDCSVAGAVAGREFDFYQCNVCGRLLLLSGKRTPARNESEYSCANCDRNVYNSLQFSPIFSHIFE